MIRPLEINELPLAYRLGLKFYKEGVLPGKLKEDVFITTWTKFISMEVGIVFGLFDQRNLIGMISGIVFPDPNDGELVATEMFWYVDKEYRGKGGIKLFLKFKEWSELVKAKRLIMVHLVGLMSDKLERFYKKQGFRSTEIHYIKEL